MRRRSARRTRQKAHSAVGRKVERVMREFKRGTLRSGRSGRRVESRAQAIAIGLAEARAAGARRPRRRSSG
jgi:hypothetical protein